MITPVPLSAQLDNLRTLKAIASTHKLMRGGIIRKASEGDLIHERLAAAIKTLEALVDKEGR